MTSKRSIPLRVYVKLGEFDEDGRVENWPFREIVGTLMWLSISTRPDCEILCSAESYSTEGSP